MAKESSLPPSLRAHLYDRPQEPQGLSPTTSSPGAQDEVDLPSPTFAPPRQPAFPLPPIVPSTLPPAFPDARRQYSAYEPGAHDPARRHSPTRLSPLGGSSSIPHGPARRYRSPVGSDPLHPATVRQQPPAGYPGSVSLPALSQITAPPSHWREGEAGPSSLVHSSHTYGALRRQSPNYPPPQGIYRRATEPGGYPSESAHLQPGFHGSYERLREQPEGYPSRPTPGHQYSESSSSRLSLPPLYGRAGEQVDLPPLYSALQSQSSLSSDFTRVDDGPRGVKRHFPEDFEDERRAFQNMPRKILVACDFCRGRKLRCDGRKPTCGNCDQRHVKCEYRAQPKRRGPGKAAKGTRSKKRMTKGRHSDPSSRRSVDEDFDMGPELRSQRSLDSGLYSSRTTLVESRYDSRQESPEWQGDSRRTSRSGAREEPSSDDYSGPSEGGESKR